MTDLLIFAIIVLCQIVWAAWFLWFGHHYGHRLGYCRGKRDGRQEMWDAFYRQRPEVSAEIGEPFELEPAIPIEPCQWCVDCIADACGCKTCHPRD